MNKKITFHICDGSVELKKPGISSTDANSQRQKNAGPSDRECTDKNLTGTCYQTPHIMTFSLFCCTSLSNDLGLLN